jgi:hypothetical protein
MRSKSAHESLLNRRPKAPPPAVGIAMNSAWAKPERTHVGEALDGVHESRLLKKSLSYGFEHSVVAEVERDLNLEGAVVTEFG